MRGHWEDELWEPKALRHTWGKGGCERGREASAAEKRKKAGNGVGKADSFGERAGKRGAFVQEKNPWGGGGKGGQKKSKNCLSKKGGRMKSGRARDKLAFAKGRRVIKPERGRVFMGKRRKKDTCAAGLVVCTNHRGGNIWKGTTIFRDLGGTVTRQSGGKKPSGSNAHERGIWGGVPQQGEKEMTGKRDALTKGSSIKDILSGGRTVKKKKNYCEKKGRGELEEGERPKVRRRCGSGRATKTRRTVEVCPTLKKKKKEGEEGRVG